MQAQKIEAAVKAAGLVEEARPLDYREPRKWLALICTPGRERTAADWIKRSNFWVYWPNFTKQVAFGGGARGKQRQRRPVPCAIMPGYLFLAVRLNAEDPWQVTLHTPGVTGFVRGATEHATALSDYDIEVIRKVEGRLNLPYDPKSAHRFKPGDKVQFADDLKGRWGPAKVDRLADDGRIIVHVPLLGRIVPTEVFPDQIEAM